MIFSFFFCCLGYEFQDRCSVQSCILFLSALSEISSDVLCQDLVKKDKCRNLAQPSGLNCFFLVETPVPTEAWRAERAFPEVEGKVFRDAVLGPDEPVERDGRSCGAGKLLGVLGVKPVCHCIEPPSLTARRLSRTARRNGPALRTPGLAPNPAVPVEVFTESQNSRGWKGPLWVI